MIVSGSTIVRLGAAIRAGCTIVGLSTLILFALSCRLPTASAQSLQLNEKGEIVPDLAAARRALDSARGSTRAARGVDSEAGQLQRMVPDEKTEGLKAPIVVLSDSKARSTRGVVRTPLSDRKQASAQRALETMVRDESGKWYELEYPDIDPDLEISQRCTIEADRLPSEMRAPSASGPRRLLQSGEPEPKIEPASHETPASISLLFVEVGVPCILKVVCWKPDDPRCREPGFIVEFAGRDRRDIVHAPPAR
jgi:hypothetical protein